MAPNRPISSEFPYQKLWVDVLGSQMAYVDVGASSRAGESEAGMDGATVLFLHGNPTSSYLWRNIIPYVTRTHRAVAVDLIGMGDSGKPDLAYDFADHARYVDAFVATLDLRQIVLVVHDWGSALGMRYARLNESNVAGLAFMEAIVPPALPVPSYEALGPQAGAMFKSLRTPGEGEELVLEQNFFVEVVLAKFGVLRELTEAEMAAYRAPFATRESRLPTLVWPRQIPIAGEPADVVAEIEANGAWLATSAMPKLLLHAEPGALITEAVVDALVRTVPNLRTHLVGPGYHFIQEDRPHEIGTILADWLHRSPNAD